jgi:hypothetical protein
MMAWRPLCLKQWLTIVARNKTDYKKHVYLMNDAKTVTKSSKWIIIVWRAW